MGAEEERINRILKLLDILWHEFPDWRLGQLLNNVIPVLEDKLFYTEDTLVEDMLNHFKSKHNVRGC